MCAKAGWVILKDMVWFSRDTFLLSGCLSSVCPLSLSSLTGFRPNLVLVLHPLSCPRCPSSLLLSPPTPPPPRLFSFLSLYEILPYPILSLRPLSPGVAGEIRGYNFLQSAESVPQHLTPSSLALPPTRITTMAGGRGTPAVSVRNLPSFCLLHWLGHFHLLIAGKEQTGTEEKKH